VVWRDGATPTFSNHRDLGSRGATGRRRSIPLWSKQSNKTICENHGERLSVASGRCARGTVKRVAWRDGATPIFINHRDLGESSATGLAIIAIQEKAERLAAGGPSFSGVSNRQVHDSATRIFTPKRVGYGFTP